MAAVTGAIVAHVHGLVCIKFKGDHIVSGVAINILAMGATPFIAGALFGTTQTTPEVARSLGTWRIPGIGAVIGEYSPLVYLSWLAVPLAYVLVFRTRFGLRLRASGENPWAAETAGVNVAKVRYLAVLLSGVFAGLGGAFLSIGYGAPFVRNMTAGRGFLALAALIFGRWTPVGALAACLLFGFFDALQMRLQGVGGIPPQFVQMIPYKAPWGGQDRLPRSARVTIENSPQPARSAGCGRLSLAGTTYSWRQYRSDTSRHSV
jgi:simple sugar transport system permease protein